MINRASLLITALLCTTACIHAAEPAVQDGDIIFHTSRSAQSLAVQKATSSTYSHMGLILLRDGKPYVFESISTVQYTPLSSWIARGQDGRYVIKRLSDAGQRLTSASLTKLRNAAQEFEGRPYDLTFEWSDDRTYCSELVWKVYDRALGVQLAPTQKLREFNLSDPIVKAKMHERYGDKPPLDATVISPVAIFNAPSLVTVSEH